MKKIILVFLAMCMMCILSGHTAVAQYKFYAGDEWIAIGRGIPSASVRRHIKTLMLQAAQDASAFSGTPIISVNEKDLTKYIDDIDEFYGNKDNMAMPLYFALRIADMKKQGIPPQQVEAYRSLIIQKFKEMGITP